MTLDELDNFFKEKYESFIFCGIDKDTGNNEVGISGTIDKVSGNVHTVLRDICKILNITMEEWIGVLLEVEKEVRKREK